MLDVLCVGHASYDITMAAAHHPAADEKMQAASLQLAGGGPAANAALCIARLGGTAGFCGYLGHDLFGAAHLNELTAEGVDTSLLVRGDHPTPLSQILAKPDGSRSVVNFKANTPFIAAATVALQQAPKVILFDGHEPLISEPMCRWAKAHGVTTVLDAGSLHRGTRMLADAVDYLVASETFARQFSGVDDLPSALRRMPNPNTVITMGKHGLIWRQHDACGALPAFDVDAIDSTGAGDAFHAAFAYGLSQAMGRDALLRYASAAGAFACTALGARASLPDAGQLQSLLKKYNRKSS